MEGTLKERLEGLDNTREVVDPLLASLLSPGIITSAKNEVLRDFYTENPIAYSVARGEDSYQDRIKPILNKYDLPFWKKMFSPKPDDQFDLETIATIESLNEVGIAGSFQDLKLFPSLSYTDFTTEGRKGNIRYFNGLVLAFGGALGGLFYLLTDAQTITLFQKVVPPAILGLTYLALTPSNATRLNEHLTSLKEIAKESDDFLRSTYTGILL
ncbi:MAG: hypothetical protein WCV90_07390 [Candidatus Woesearchaeota archaeon]|jgi:hypothetical protein